MNVHPIGKKERRVCPNDLETSVDGRDDLRFEVFPSLVQTKRVKT